MSWLEVPPIIFDDTKHYVDNDMDSLRMTACGINFTEKDWTSVEEEVHPRRFCWQCARVGGMHNEIGQLQKVVEAALAWKEDPDSGPLRGRLSEALDFYCEWYSGPDFEFDDESPPE
jgi:hypothetical protein